MKTNPSVTLGLACMALTAQTGCLQSNSGAPESKKPKLVFITSGTNMFWHDASAGIEAAAHDFKAQFELVTSSSSAPGDEESDGIAFAPINGAVQLVASGGRVCFVGVDHYRAGSKAGALVKEVIPDGGKIVIFSQTPDFVLAQERHRGITDELPESRFLIVDANSKSAILQHLDAGVVIALSSRDLAVCAELLCARDRLDEIRLFGFDEDPTTRDLLAAGHLYCIVTAQPYQYGYQAVRVLAGVSRGDISVLPRSGFLDLPLVVLGRETASQSAGSDLHSPHDSTLFPRADAGNLDRATQTGNLAADRVAGSGSVVR